TIIRYLSKYLSKKDTDKSLSIAKLCYLIDFSTGIVAFIILTATSSITAAFFLKNPEFNNLIILFASTLVISTVNTSSESVLYVFNKFQKASVLSCIYSVMEIGLISIALVFDNSIKNVFIAIIIAKVLHSSLLNIIAYRTFKKNIGKSFFYGKINSLKNELKEISFFAINTSLTSFLKMFATNIDVLLLGYIRNPHEVGIYKIATTIIGALYIPVVSLIKVLYPTLSKLVSDKKYKRFKTLNLYSLGGSLVYGLLVVFFLWFIIDKIIILLYGSDYLYAQYLFKLMSIGAVFGLALSISRPILLSLYDTTTNNVSLLGMGIIWISLGPLLINSYGYSGAATVYSIAIVLGALYSVIKVLHHNRKI
ncbi:MAG: oligosaccharide flippase family protein, partial [Candidatus Omnitrophica bacterium]|nr:oligosaccharide flippase family protein [Candidatus Omnitrophota bacterium]